MVFSLVLSLLVEADAFDGEFDVIGLFVGVEFDEGLEATGHAGGAGFDEVLKAQFVFGFCAPVDGFFAFVLVVVGKIEDIGTLELEGAYSFDIELTAVEAFLGEDGDGFVGGVREDRVNTSLEGFFLGAQGAQEL